VAQSHFDRDTIINDHCCQYLVKPADIDCALGYESRESRPAWMRRCLGLREKHLTTVDVLRVPLVMEW
jgi:hypothetical protein